MKKLVEDFIAHNRAAYHGHTESAYRYHTAPFCRFFKNTPPEDITSAHVARWMEHMLKVEKVNPNTMLTYLKRLKLVFAYGVRNGRVKVSPIDKEALPRVKAARINRRPFTLIQFDRICKVARELAVPESNYYDFWPLACNIAWHTGMRISDVSLLEWKSVNFTDEVLIVWPRKKEAIREQLIIPMEPELYTGLLEAWNTRDQTETEPDVRYVMPLMRRAYLFSRERLELEFKRLCNKAECHGVVFHSFRHAFVSRLINAGVSPQIIITLVGMTEAQVKSYTHVSDDAKRVALSASREFLAKSEAARDNIQPQGVSAAEF